MFVCYVDVRAAAEKLSQFNDLPNLTVRVCIWGLQILLYLLFKGEKKCCLLLFYLGCRTRSDSH